MPACPQCGTEVQPHWDWCERCGYDPDGLRARTTAALAPPVATVPPAARAGGAPGLPPPAPPLPPPGPPLTPAAGLPPAAPALPWMAPTPSGGHTALRVVAIVVACVVALFVVLIVAVTLLGRSESDPSAHAWTTPDGAVTVMMRGTPSQLATPTEPGLSSTSQWQAKNHSSSFSVEDDVISPGVQVDAAKVLAAVPTAVTATVPSATITASTPTTFQGYPAQSFSYRAPSQNAVAKGIAVMTPTHLFVVVAGTTPTDTDKIDPYLKSFKINP